MSGKIISLRKYYDLVLLLIVMITYIINVVVLTPIFSMFQNSNVNSFKKFSTSECSEKGKNDEILWFRKKVAK